MESELRKKILDKMCRAVENIEYFSDYEAYQNITYFSNEIPEYFKPGVADRLLFKKILNEYPLNISSELKKHPFTDIGLNLMLNFFYPQYGTWKIINRREARKKLKEINWED